MQVPVASAFSFALGLGKHAMPLPVVQPAEHTQPVSQYLRLQYLGIQYLHDYALLVSLGMERSNERISDSLSPITVTVSGELPKWVLLWKHTCFSLVPVHYLLLVSHGQDVKQKNTHHWSLELLTICFQPSHSICLIVCSLYNFRCSAWSAQVL